MGLHFQNFHFSREFSSGMNQKKVLNHLHPNRNLQEFVVNGKQTLFQLILDTFEVGCIIWTPVSFVFSKLCIGVDLYIKLKHSDPFYMY